ncbi:error-prone DNA polymerase [Agrococcus versicolor]|uniref:Error-prone DNA polymerase n=1 Tax=Agrococcus versicolor TaxID=501482 RepID=A0ABN3ARL8_9MICO
MGWRNPPMPWRELEAILDGRAAEAPSLEPYPQERERRSRPDPERLVPYAELHAHSHYSFLDGASSPAQLVTEATALGLEALALVDHDGLYGAVRFAEAADAVGLPTIFGAELSLELPEPQNGVADPVGDHLLVLARGPEGYRRLAATLTDGYLAGGEKGRPVLHLEQVAERAGEWLVSTGCRKGAVRRALERDGADAARVELDRLVSLFGRDGVMVELTDLGLPDDGERNQVLATLALERGLPLVATTNAHVASPRQQLLGDAMAAVRARRSIDELDGWLPAGGVPRLRSGAEMRWRFRAFDGVVERAAAIGRELAFGLRAASPRLPDTEVPEGHTQISWLRQLVAERRRRVYPDDDPAVDARLQHELRLIEEKGFAGYFLIVCEIADFAHANRILCQGRGSAVASAVCFILGITAVDPILYRLPFERFISMIREEEPDIDIDFDASRREEVIQHVYERYGRRNAAQVANVITYRPKSAVRDAAKALGYAVGQQNAWSKRVEGWSTPAVDGTEGIPDTVLTLADDFLHSPRHLGIHSGGMVLTKEPVGHVCPIEPGRMEGRTVLQWDKDDCEWMGLVKFDLLGLGMLGAMQHTMDIAAEHLDERWTVATIPAEEAGVYDMLCAADAVGVFQVESRAQLATLPRLRPRAFYDLVIEIALIRPGPIQGDAVHPYLRRRNGQEPITYPHPLVEPVLERTLGVPLFQEQLMQIASAVGGFTAADGDELRRAIGSKRSRERMGELRERLFEGMRANGIVGDLADSIWRKIEAFAGFGFAESHSLAFGKLVYASSWLKLHHPAAFLAGLLRAQPMGFWSGQTLSADARRHGVEVLGPDIVRSAAMADLEAHGERTPGDEACMTAHQPPVPQEVGPNDHARHRRDRGFAVRLGIASVAHVSDADAARVVAARDEAPFTGIDDVARRARLDRRQLESLATAGAFASLGLERREALWLAAPASTEREDQLAGTSVTVQPPLLPIMSEAEQTALDIWATGVSPDDHPVRHARAALEADGVEPIASLSTVEPGRRRWAAGIVTHRQRPQTAQGVTFMNIEDETGMLNVVCSVGLWKRYRSVAKHSAALKVRGILQHSQGVVTMMADRIEPFDAAAPPSRDFR